MSRSGRRNRAGARRATLGGMSEQQTQGVFGGTAWSLGSVRGIDVAIDRSWILGFTESLGPDLYNSLKHCLLQVVW